MTHPDRRMPLNRLQAKNSPGVPIGGGASGTALSAKCEEAGGIDLIVSCNRGRYSDEIGKSKTPMSAAETAVTVVIGGETP